MKKKTFTYEAPKGEPISFITSQTVPTMEVTIDTKKGEWDDLTNKDFPVFSGVLSYFPLALKEVARVSVAGNKQHNKDASFLYWDRKKSHDHADALARHLLNLGFRDDDGILHSAKVAWRALANLEIELESRLMDGEGYDNGIE